MDTLKEIEYKINDKNYIQNINYNEKVQTSKRNTVEDRIIDILSLEDFVIDLKFVIKLIDDYISIIENPINRKILRLYIQEQYKVYKISKIMLLSSSKIRKIVNDYINLWT